MDVCETVLEKKQKQAISTLCKIEMWVVYRCLKYYFDTVHKLLFSKVNLLFDKVLF